MSSRDHILEVIRKNQPKGLPLQEIAFSDGEPFDKISKFTTVLESIGGTVIPINEWGEVEAYLNQRFSTEKRWVNLVPELRNLAPLADFTEDPHLLENVMVAILPGHFGVAENGAVWITEELMGDRALPFICEHLALIIRAENIFPTLHDAYTHIDKSQYGFGTYIAGPSKTADIEQSLVLGAHGPKSLMLFLITET
ncbi:MAG: LUD domain-containing protein [Cyclobacteriaceae bacterium]|nr:LUD domain-containing protein [Cyclobacteriaceae bacterium]MDH4298843.1 LUD domain-containing protein [Cyclobacteriaceae bacterium]MDH5248350.1 LUD domain-containing protein [Cyclobacteriaceae bacterium]